MSSKLSAITDPMVAAAMVLTLMSDLHVHARGQLPAV